MVHHKPQSVPGIISFVISIVAILMLIITFCFAGFFESRTPEGMDEDSVEAISIGIFMILCIGLLLVSLCVGIGSLFQRDRMKVFGILGVVFSFASITFAILLIALGMAMG